MDVRSFYFGQYDLLERPWAMSATSPRLIDLVTERHVPPPHIDRCFPLDAAADAHQYLETARVFGKSVLEHQ